MVKPDSQSQAMAASELGPARMLESVGVTEPEEGAYLELLRHPGRSPADMGRALGMSARRAGELLAALEGRGLVSVSATRPPVYVPASPSVALEILILGRQEELARTRMAARRLEEEFRKSGQAAESRQLVEVIKGPDAFVQRFLQLLSGAEREIVGFSTPPFLVAGDRALPFKLDLLRRGTTVRGVYSTAALEVPGEIEFMEALAAEGEQIRTATRLPMRFIAADRRLALIPLDTDGLGVHLLVHASALLDALLAMFEMLWERATPFNPLATGPASEMSAAAKALSPVDRRVLALMAAGLRDGPIAEKLGMVDRTAQRRVTRMMGLLGAETRFQAGVLAAQQGWLGEKGRKT